MREIKFRVWNSFIKEMQDFTKIKNAGIFALDKGLNSSDFIVLPLRNTILMQYTGLKDKNGVEIYEGDIVKHIDWDNKIYRIEFLNGSFILRRDFENIINKDFQEVDYGLEIEVIGNIYENKELLSD